MNKFEQALKTLMVQLGLDPDKTKYKIDDSKPMVYATVYDDQYEFKFGYTERDNRFGLIGFKEIN